MVIVMTAKLFVGGLSWDTREDDLERAFSAHGEVVEAKVIMDRDSGRSRGFGFVTFANESDAQNAMRELDGSTLDGRTIRVNEANSDSRGGGGGGGGGGRRGGGGGGRGGGGGGGRGRY